MIDQETNHTSELQNAFIKRLPNFSLPPNLNNKLVANKKKLTSSRPRLSNLRSAWLSTQSIEEDFFEKDKLINITLSPPVPSLLLVNETQRLITIATCFSLASPILASTLAAASNIYIASSLIGLWLILFAWHSFGRSDSFHLKINVLLTMSLLTSLCIVRLSYNEAALFSSFLACTLFALAKRLFNLQTSLLSSQSSQHAQDQKVVDTALASYYDRRHMFLTTVSQEIRDASLMVIATLEQFSPTSILSNTHELLSACSIAVPITSIAAINTIIKQACHISSHLNLISRMLREANSKIPLTEDEKVRSTVKQDFDVSELIQNVGDALAGMASKLGVHFVIYHTDNGLYYSNVIGDQDAIKHALINVSC